MGEKQKRLLLVATRQFWPTAAGKSLTLYHFCKGLHERYGYDIYLFCFADRQTDKTQERPGFIHDVVYADVPGIKRSWRTVVSRSFLFGSWPIQNAILYDRGIEQKLHRYYEQIRPDVIIIDMVRLVPYAETLRAKKKILLEDDLLAKRYQRQLASAKGGNLAGTFAENLPPLVNRIVELRFVRSFILRTEIRRLEKYEKHCVQMFDYVTFISPVEAEEYNELHHTQKGITLTTGADIPYLTQKLAVETIPDSLSVVGNYQFAANAASMEWVCRDILPKLPDTVQYYVIGKFPEELRGRIDTNKLKLLGFVDDFRTAVEATEIYFAPILFGSGIKTKIVEAMAMGMPVVTNNVGAEGLDVHDGQELLIAETPDELAGAVMRLLGDSALREKIGKAGQRYVRENHDWEKIYQVFGEMEL